jgi:hypothetical protein
MSQNRINEAVASTLRVLNRVAEAGVSDATIGKVARDAMKDGASIEHVKTAVELAGRKFDLSMIAPTISDAAAAEHQTRDKWVRVGKGLHKAGVTVGMLIRPTEKNPNPQFDAGVFVQVRTAIIQGVSAAKRPMTFTDIVPGTISAENPKGSNKWSVADLLALTGEQLKECEDDVLRTQRRKYVQLIDGPMMGRVRSYLDREENPDRVRSPKAAKAEEKSAPTMRGDTLDGARLMLRALLAGKNSVCGSRTLSRYENALTEALACLS